MLSTRDESMSMPLYKQAFRFIWPMCESHVFEHLLIKNSQRPISARSFICPHKHMKDFAISLQFHISFVPLFMFSQHIFESHISLTEKHKQQTHYGP